MSKRKWHIDKTKVFLHNVLVCKKSENLEIYILNGKLHNPNGPAFLEWYENGQLRREQYWVNGKYLTQAQFLARLNK